MGKIKILSPVLVFSLFASISTVPAYAQAARPATVYNCNPNHCYGIASRSTTTMSKAMAVFDAVTGNFILSGAMP